MLRLLTILTYILALSFVLFATSIQEVRFIFPVWVFLTSIYILTINQRLEQMAESS